MRLLKLESFIPAARQARSSSCRSRLAAGGDERAQQRELRGLEDLLGRLGAVGDDLAAGHGDAGQPLAELAEDVLGHHELAHALVAADAGVQVGEAHHAAHAEHLGHARDDGVLGDGRQVEPAGTPLQPHEVGGLGDDGGHDLVVDPHGEVGGHAARHLAHAGGARAPDDGAGGVDHGGDDGDGVARRVRGVGQDDAHVLDGVEREGRVAAEHGGGGEQARRVEGLRGDVLVGEAPRQVVRGGGRGVRREHERAVQGRRVDGASPSRRERRSQSWRTRSRVMPPSSRPVTSSVAPPRPSQPQWRTASCAVRPGSACLGDLGQLGLEGTIGQLHGGLHSTLLTWRKDTPAGVARSPAGRIGS